MEGADLQEKYISSYFQTKVYRMVPFGLLLNRLLM